MKKMKNVILLSLIFVLVMAIIPTYTMAINPEDYKPGGIDQSDSKPITDIANPIVGGIKVLGIVVAVVMMIVMGIKFMTGSIEEKAEYKKSILPYLIGAILVVAITQLLGVIIEIVGNVDV